MIDVQASINSLLQVLVLKVDDLVTFSREDITYTVVSFLSLGRRKISITLWYSFLKFQ